MVQVGTFKVQAGTFVVQPATLVSQAGTFIVQLGTMASQAGIFKSHPATPIFNFNNYDYPLNTFINQQDKLLHD